VEETDDSEATPNGPASVLQILLTAPDSTTLNGAVGQFRGIPGVDAVTERSLAIGGSSTLFVTYRGDVSALRAALMARGWSVDYAGGMLRVSRALRPAPVQSPPVQPPPVPVDGQAR
jgi:hypothetical protein